MFTLVFKEYSRSQLLSTLTEEKVPLAEMSIWITDHLLTAMILYPYSFTLLQENNLQMKLMKYSDKDTYNLSKFISKDNWLVLQAHE